MDYKSSYKGEEIDEAVGKVLNGETGGITQADLDATLEAQRHKDFDLHMPDAETTAGYMTYAPNDAYWSSLDPDSITYSTDGDSSQISLSWTYNKDGIPGIAELTRAMVSFLVSDNYNTKGVILRGIKNPAGENDAANKAYVDGRFAALKSEGLSLEGASLDITGSDLGFEVEAIYGAGGIQFTSVSRSSGIWFYIAENPTAGGKECLAFSDLNTSGPIVLQGVAEPEQNEDAANKAYVDAAIQTAVQAAIGAAIEEAY